LAGQKTKEEKKKQEAEKNLKKEAKNAAMEEKMDVETGAPL
jgi:hypothetical protein